MGIKDFFLKQALKYKLKDVPEGEREKLLSVMEKNPEFFKKVGEEIEKLKKSGQSEMSATLIVMRKYQAELQRIMKE